MVAHAFKPIWKVETVISGIWGQIGLQSEF